MYVQNNTQTIQEKKAAQNKADNAVKISFLFENTSSMKLVINTHKIFNKFPIIIPLYKYNVPTCTYIFDVIMRIRIELNPKSAILY